MSHLKQLEDESIYIFREVYAEFENPVMLYSVGKDSSVMVRLAQKAFAPGKIPFPLMHIDTGYKHPEMYKFRDTFCDSIGARLIVHSNEECIKKGTHPDINGRDRCCSVLKTKALLDGIRKYKFDAAFGGARRDEEKSRAKERIYSVRDTYGQWDPKNQRPELWDLFNSYINEGETVRVFPISNWTEEDIWNYIKQEEVPIVPLYYPRDRKVVERGGVYLPANLLGVDGGFSEENTITIKCRFRSLGCIPCTGLIPSNAQNLDDLIKEVVESKRSERENRVIDLTSESSMEKKKREGYF
jgi:sulfate adenylyltransferase subunit 2